MTHATFREVRPGIYVLHLPLPMRPTIVNAYLLRSGDEWALVDTGMNTGDSVAAFRDMIDAIGCPPARIGKILCTHHHPDHYGASRALKDLTGAEVYLHPLEYERALAFAPDIHSEQARTFLLASGLPYARFADLPPPRELWGSLYMTVPPDHGLSDGEVVRVGEREVEVVWTPGHAPGHCVFYLRGEGVMIAGDHLLPKITPHVGYMPGGVPNPLHDFLASQRKVQRFDVDVVLPAHGPAFGDHRHRANQIIEHHHYRLREMLDAVRPRPATAYEIAAKAFGFDSDASPAVQFPATFETMAHLQYLIHTGEVVSEDRNGRVLYGVAGAARRRAAE